MQLDLSQCDPTPCEASSSPDLTLLQIPGTCVVDNNGLILAVESSQERPDVSAIVPNSQAPDPLVGRSISEVFPALSADLLSELPFCEGKSIALRSPLGVALQKGSSARSVALVIRLLRTNEATWVLISVDDESNDLATPHDPLTGLPMRPALARRWLRWKRYAASAPEPSAVVFLDLDQFKSVNDNSGHAAGDAVLAEVAQRWKQCLREDDLLVRYGGDEFVVLLRHVAELADALRAVERLRVEASRPFVWEGRPVSVEVSAGIALSRGESDSLEQLIAEADRDMYARKSASPRRPK